MMKETIKNKVVGDIKKIIDSGINDAYSGVNAVMINTYWKVGRRIVEEEQQGEERAEYGTNLLQTIASELVPKYGSSYNARNLYNMRLFYQYFKNLEILNARVQNLKWTHIRSLLRVGDENARYWYLNEASKEMWNTRTLDRNIGSQYYYRLLLCSETSRDIAKYSVLNGSKQLFASKYLTCLPSEEELRREIERQKEIFMLQQKSEGKV